MTTLGHKIVEYAKTYDRKAWVENGSPGPYCALFVRHCFKKHGIQLADSRHPSDLRLMRPSDGGLAPSFANSLAGDEIGARIASKSNLAEGDIVFFSHTDMRYTPGIITHVGISAGGGMIVDRGSTEVNYRSINTFHHFFEGRRPRALASAATEAVNTDSTVINLSGGRVDAKLHGKHVHALKLGIFTNGHNAYVELNNRAFQASSYQAEFQTTDGWIKAFGHHGRHHMQGASAIVVEASHGALHVKAGSAKQMLSEIKVLKGRIEVMTGNPPDSAFSGAQKAQVGGSAYPPGSAGSMIGSQQPYSSGSGSGR